MNQLFFGDNLDVLRESIKDESVDLVYLDPPFNSNRDYNQIFKSPDGKHSHAQIEAFEDTWHWEEQASREFQQIIEGGNTNAADLIDAFTRFLGKNDLTAYLVMMTNRLIELHRVLKPTGSLYLHCDPTASHYLKLVLDAVFGVERFQNEIIWQRSTGKALMTRRLPNNHDVILAYHRSEGSTWNPDTVFTPYDLGNLDEKTSGKYSLKDPDGRAYQLCDITNPNPNRPNLTYEFLGVTKVWRWTKERMQAAYDAGLVIKPSPGSIPRFKRYLDEQKGRPLGDVWTDIAPINSQAQERLGYPTQKPLALLERIINASSNPGDVVLDPFCGCGTAVHAAEKLGRQWIGIDITHLAISLIEVRLRHAFPAIKFEVHGTPKDLEGAQDLARRDKYQFQYWACPLVGAVPWQNKKKGADGGIDGQRYFHDIEGREQVNRRIIVSVKGGDSVSVPMIRDLVGTIEREKAPIGLFVTLAEPTKPMREEAAKAGFYRGGNGKDYPKIQILTIQELLDGRKRPEFPEMSFENTTYKKAKREKVKAEGSTPLFEEE